MLYLISIEKGIFPFSNPMLPKQKHTQGQILLAILIAIAVFAILTHALFTLIASSFNLVAYNKARITARHLAQEKIELVRNLAYDQVGTVAGVPVGIIEQEEAIVRNGLNYTIKTDIAYFDDPFDGLATDTDTNPEDYKRVRIEVSWEGIAASKKNPVVLITDVSAEASSVEGGTLVIQVFDANGNPVPQAGVVIFSASVSPIVNITTKTGSDGRVIRPGMTPCVECYQITVTKSGMSTDRTYSSSEVANPLKPHASIFLDSVTQVSFAIDTLGTITIHSTNSRENNFTALANATFRLRGNKYIGTNALAQQVYKYDQNLTTNGSGNITLTGMEWDVYHVLMPTIPTYDISGTNPLLPLYLDPSGTVDFTFATSTHTDHSFFITVKDTSQNLIASASARLFDGGGYDQTKQTGLSNNPDFGQVIFSGLTEDTYTLEATASGFLNYTETFDVSGYTKADVVMTPE